MDRKDARIHWVDARLQEDGNEDFTGEALELVGRVADVDDLPAAVDRVTDVVLLAPIQSILFTRQR